jgi:hypothetical protein
MISVKFYPQHTDKDDDTTADLSKSGFLKGKATKAIQVYAGNYVYLYLYINLH